MDVLPTFFSIALGAGIAALGFLLRERRENSRMYARALSELLEIRYSALRIPRLMDVMVAHLGAPQDEWKSWRPLILSLAPKPLDAAKRFDAAVTMISDFHPMLAFELRHKGIAADLEGFFAPFSSVEGSAQQIPIVIDALRPDLEHAMDRAVLSLAWHVGPWVWLRTWRHVRKPIRIDREMAQLISRVKSFLPTE